MPGILRLLIVLVLAAAAAPAPAAGPDLLPGIIGDDDRVPLDTDAWPWQAIGRVNRAQGGFCTGTLVAPRRVLTAAHCVFRRGRPIVPADLHFLAGYRRGEFVAHGRARSVTVAPGYDPDSTGSPASLARDWAILELEEALPVRPVPVDAAADPAAGKVLRAGYSQDRAHLLAVHEGCAVERADAAGLLLHDCDATRGDSGSPLLRRDGDRVAIIGIDVGTGSGRGIGVPAAGFAAAVAR